MATPLDPRVADLPRARSAFWKGRIAGLDLARAVALIGMFAAHIGDAGTRGADSDGSPWLWVADGRSSAIFAVLAGVTLSLLAAKDPVGPGHAAVRVAVRGVALIGAGYALGALGTPVDVILTNLGVMFLLAIPALWWRSAQLFVAGAAVLVMGGLAFPVIEDLGEGIPILEKIASHHYPAAVWIGYLLIGMAVGRTDLTNRRAAGLLVWWGMLAAGLAYGLGALAGGALPWADAHGAANLAPGWASIAPHSNTAFELVGNTGVALLVIGVCLVAVRPSRWAFPVLAFGSMSLTMYTAHLLVIAAVGSAIVWEPSNVALVSITLTLMAAASAWRVFLGSGPLERLLTRTSTAAADALAR